MSNEPFTEPPRPGPQAGSYNIIQSFRFAIKGAGYALKHERNLRIHLCAAVYVLFLSISYYDLSPAEYALLVLVIGLVITCEMFNTAIEKTVDIRSPVYNGLAKIAKDVAAGAVLVSSITAVAVGLFLLWDLNAFTQIGYDLADHFWIVLPLLIITVIWIIWPKRKAIHRRWRRAKKK